MYFQEGTILLTGLKCSKDPKERILISATWIQQDPTGSKGKDPHLFKGSKGEDPHLCNWRRVTQLGDWQIQQVDHRSVKQQIDAISAKRLPTPDASSEH